jgi:exosortase/archaeosortase family protein
VWIDTPQPVRRFIVRFILYMALFTPFFYGVLIKTRLFEAYLGLNATVSAFILKILGEDVWADGVALEARTSPGLEIRHGCDAILPTALFLAAVMAFPVVMRVKWPALLLGSAGLLGLNLVRIITLYYTRVHKPEWFHSMHVDVWQPAFIFAALLLWILWALTVTRTPPAGPAPTSHA